MTYPERVSRHNLQHLRSLIINGPKQWPGANYVEKRSADLADGDRVVVGAVGGGHKKSLNYGDRNAVARDLKVGDVVERHMRDGDVVLFNRQPSLHKLSIMCHSVKVMRDRTFKLNECVCAPYNARGGVPSTTSSNRARHRKKDHPAPSLTETSRVDGVKAPQHRGTSP